MSGTLYHSPEECVHKLLQDLGETNLPGEPGAWPSWVNHSGSINQPHVLVHGTTGRTFGKLQVAKRTLQAYGIQIQVRAAQAVSFRKCNDILIALDSVRRSSVVLDASTYIVHALVPTSPIIRVGREQPEDFLFIYSLNLLASLTLDL